VDRDLNVIPLLRVRVRTAEVELVLRRSIEVGGASSGIRSDGDRVGQEDLTARRPAGRRLEGEADRSVEVALVVAEELEVESAIDVRLVGLAALERHAVDLDSPVVSLRVGHRRDGEGQAGEHDHDTGDQRVHFPAPSLGVWRGARVPRP
jgi:hypothetical protein